jgi:hypothetical protein
MPIGGKAMMPREYTCECCKQTFTEGWSNEEAMSEMKASFGNMRPEELSVVCDDCYQKMRPDKFPHIAEESVAETLKAREAKHKITVEEIPDEAMTLAPVQTKPTVILPVKHYRCTKGHQWEGYDDCVYFRGWTGFPDQNFCIRCIFELLKNNCGTIEEIPDAASS